MLVYSNINASYLVSAFESFQKQIEMVLNGCKNARNISNDIIIRGDTIDEHDVSLKEVLSRLSHAN